MNKIMIVAGIILIANGAKADPVADRYRHQEDLLNYYKSIAKQESKLMRARERAASKAYRKARRNYNAYVAMTQSEQGLVDTEQRMNRAGVHSSYAYEPQRTNEETILKW